MNETQKPLAVMLGELSQLADRLSEEQLQKLLNGDVRLSLVAKRSKKPKIDKPKSPCVAPKPLRPSMAQVHEDFANVHERLVAAKTRDECAILVDYILPNKEDLFAFAGHLQLAVQWKESKHRLREKIVEATAGARIDAEIIRGGY